MTTPMETTNKPATVLIVDDHPLVREGLTAHISVQPDMEVCCAATNIDEALALIESRPPAIVIIDLALKNEHGLQLIKRVKQCNPDVKMLVLSAQAESLYAERSLKAGAHGFISKQEAQDKIIEAIRTVLHGERYLSPAMTQQLMERASSSTSKASGVESLSDRELEVFHLIGLGWSTRTIANQLHLSIHTIETHRENIRAKLGLHNGAELVQRAVQWTLESI